MDVLAGSRITPFPGRCPGQVPDTVEHDEFPGLHFFEFTTIQEAVEFGFGNDQVKACPGLDPGSNLTFRKRLASTSFSVA